MTATLPDVAAELDPVTLAEMDDRALLRTRVDRKYVLPETAVREVLHETLGVRVLEIGGRRSFGYATTYVDTPSLESWNATARRRRRRWKVRTRRYTDSGETWVEVKTRGPRGVTVKGRRRGPDRPRGGPPGGLCGDAGPWVRAELERAGVPVVDTGRLVPTLDTGFRRTTLLLGAHGGRVTLDRELAWHAGGQEGGRGARLDGLVVLETKSATAAATPLDRRLWTLGHRPVRLSKYGTGLALLAPGLPGNRWHRVSTRNLADHLTLLEGDDR